MKYQIIEDLLSQQKMIIVFFAAQREDDNARIAKLLPTIVRHKGHFDDLGDGYIHTQGMKTPLHVSHAICVIDASQDRIVFGQFCPDCDTAVTEPWANCPHCMSPLVRSSLK